ncbi:UNVERIFIED_CONTAM: hypothetical protein FKN15_074495 [Acipenser sinensis]
MRERLSLLVFLLCLSVVVCSHASVPVERSRQRQLSLRRHREKGKEGQVLHRSKRGWVWNQFFVIEEYTGPDPVLVGRLHSDVDSGEGKIKYILSGEGAGTIFVIDDKTGNIHATKTLDREERAQYTLTAQAVARDTNKPLEPPSEFIVKVQDINDNPPEFLHGPYHAMVSEMSNVGTSVMQVTASDADDPTYGNSARLVYSILEGQPYFSVEPHTGIIRTALPNMDREAKEEYNVVIQAKDMGGHMGGLSGTTKVTITLTDVNDNPPKFPQSVYAMSVSEASVPGEEVGRIKAKDPDMGENGLISYRVLEGDGADVFEVTTDSQTQEGVLKLKKHVDFETKRAYSLKVEASNLILDPRFLSWGPFKDTAMVKITVEDADEPPLFTSLGYIFEVQENSPANTVVGRVHAKDTDAANSPISTAGIYVRREGGFSRQKQDLYLLPIKINDNGSPPLSSTNTLTIRVCGCDSEGTLQSCNVEPYILPAGLSTGALIAILACIVILLVIVVLFVALRRQKKEPLIVFEEEDVRENIITYDDEGGGEEDTEAFDIATLQNPDGANSFLPRKDIKPEQQYPARPGLRPAPNSVDVDDFIKTRISEADYDPTAPPYDSIQIYGYEGRGSIAGSLSSLESATTDSDLDYDYLQSWGPRFKKLADLYGSKDTADNDDS